MWFFLIIVLIVVIVVVIALLMERVRKQHLTCNRCKSIYDYDDIDYQRLGSFDKSSDSSSFSSQKTYERVEFICTCGKCGAVKRFKHNFLVYRYQYNKTQGRVSYNETYDILSEISKYLNLDFKEKAERKQLKKDIKQAVNMERCAILNAIKLEESKLLSGTTDIEED